MAIEAELAQKDQGIEKVIKEQTKRTRRHDERRTKMATFFLCALIFCIFLTASGFGLNQRDGRMIEIAFQNGFEYALNLDEGTYEKLRADNSLMREMARSLSIKYLNIVMEMNH